MRRRDQAPCSRASAVASSLDAGLLGSVMIAMIKNTTVATAGGYLADAAAVMKITFDTTGASIPIFIGLILAFMALTMPIGYFTGWLARRLAVAR